MPKPNSPLKQRDELVAKRDNAYKRYSEQTKLRQRAEHELGVAKQRLAVSQNSAAVTVSDNGAQVTQSEKAVAQAQREYDRAHAAANQALDATKAVEVNLGQLYQEEWAVFANEADMSSKRATTTLEELADSYRKAEEAWARAQVAWTPLCAAARIDGMGSFPLSGHEQRLSGWTARPPGVEVMFEMEPGLHEDPETRALMEGLV
jgi:phage-related tail protein